MLPMATVDWESEIHRSLQTHLTHLCIHSLINNIFFYPNNLIRISMWAKNLRITAILIRILMWAKNLRITAILIRISMWAKNLRITAIILFILKLLHNYSQHYHLQVFYIFLMIMNLNIFFIRRNNNNQS
jgi:hypothetical protein